MSMSKPTAACWLVCLCLSASIQAEVVTLSKASYTDQLHGFWLGQNIANWTGLVTEMDKIGGEGAAGDFYTREDWGKPDQPTIWGGLRPEVSTTIDWVFRAPNEIWGSDDDTDIEYIYLHLLATHKVTRLTAEQIRDGWLQHIHAEDTTPWRNKRGEHENFLWVSNQRAHDLMLQGMKPPQTSAPQHNPHYDMIDAQLTTEIFGLFAPGRPDLALEMAYLPIRTTARQDAAHAAEFYVVMHALAPLVDTKLPVKAQVQWLAEQAYLHLPTESTSAAMYRFVKARYEAGIAWEQARDEVYQRYQVEQRDGYTVTARNLTCNGCFAAGINFAASLVSLFYGEGSFRDTVKIAALTGWDSDNPAATWGGLLGFMLGKQKLEALFQQQFSERYNIHRTRRNFPVPNGVDTFSNMSTTALSIIDRVVEQEMGGKVSANQWQIPIPALLTSETVPR